jgi:hypothetical protein
MDMYEAADAQLRGRTRWDDMDADTLYTALALQGGWV